MNLKKIVNKKLETAKIVILGAGAAGSAIVKILYASGAKDIVVCDSKGIISRERKFDHEYKEEMVKITNPQNQTVSLSDAMKNKANNYQNAH